MRKQKNVKVNVGAGNRPRKGFVSCDMRKTKPDTVVCRMWELCDNFEDVQEIYSRHALEHLTFDEVERTIKDWYGAMAAGGKVHIIVPNTTKHIQQFLDATWDEKNYKNNLSTLGRMRGGLFGWQRETKEERADDIYWDCHKSGFNEKSIKFFFEREGFTSITTKISDNGYHLVLDAKKPEVARTKPAGKKATPKKATTPAVKTEEEPKPTGTTHIWTSPYGSSWPEKCFLHAGSERFQNGKIVKTSDIDKLIASGKLPTLLFLGNFVVDRHVIKSKALRAGIDVIHGEDGFMPHYSTLHVDPIGFCGESSLTRMIFTGSVPGEAREHSKRLREDALKKAGANPFKKGTKNVLFPLQLVGDKVNQFCLNVRDNWVSVLEHARKTLPKDVLMHVKTHPRGGKSVAELDWIKKTNNVAHYTGDLYAALRHCDGVIGSNSTVLTEARLLFDKPVWAYADSWYTNHTDLINRIDLRFRARPMPYIEHLEKGLPEEEYLTDYRDWYLGQLIARQYTQSVKSAPKRYTQWLLKRTYNSYLKHGEDIFGFEGVPQ